MGTSAQRRQAKKAARRALWRTKKAPVLNRLDLAAQHMVKLFRGAATTEVYALADIAAIRDRVLTYHHDQKQLTHSEAMRQPSITNQAQPNNVDALTTHALCAMASH